MSGEHNSGRSAIATGLRRREQKQILLQLDAGPLAAPRVQVHHFIHVATHETPEAFVNDVCRAIKVGVEYVTRNGEPNPGQGDRGRNVRQRRG